MNRRSAIAVTLCCLLVDAAAAATQPGLLARLQDIPAALMKQAAALLASGHPAQAAALYLRAGDAALTAGQPGVAEQAYQGAADAFHRAGRPADEATADEKLAAVFEQQAGTPPPKTTTPTPAAPLRPPPPVPTAKPPQPLPAPKPAAPKPAQAAAAPSAARLPPGRYVCSEFSGFLVNYGELFIRSDGTYQGIRNGGGGLPYNAYSYYPATHAISWKGELGGNFGTILLSRYVTDNPAKPYIEITFQTKYQHTMSCGREGP